MTCLRACGRSSPPDALRPPLHGWERRNGKKAGEAGEDIRQLALIYDKLEANSDETRELVAPNIREDFSRGREMRCEFIRDDAASVSYCGAPIL